MKKRFTFLIAALMLLTMMASTGTAWGQTREEHTITLDYSSFGLTTSYQLKTATVDGFSFTVNQGYKGSGNTIQMNSSKGLGTLYNTTPIPGLKSVTVNVSSGNKTYTITTGTSQNPTANSQTGGTTGTYNAASGDTYFQLKVSGASYFSSIVITYEESSASPLASIALSGDYPTSFYQGDAFNHEGMTVTATYEDETTADVTASATFSGYDMSSTGSQTVTVSYTEGEITRTATYGITVNAIPTHTATFSVNGTTTTQDFAEGATITFPADPADINGKSFVGWSETTINGTTNEAPDFVTSATMGNSDVTFYAVFATVTPGSATTVTDALNRATTGVTGTSYSNWSGKTVTSGAVYAGNSAGGNSSIQLRSTDNSGIITTTSGGKAKKVAISWNSNTSSGRTLNIYGKNSDYSATSDLYNNSYQGTLLGTVVYGTSTELTVSGDYEYIGLRSNSGAMYITTISIDWETGTPDTYSDYCTTVVAAAVETPVITVAANPFLFSTTATITCATDGATIKYSYDGETWSDYSAALTIAETKTIYAKGIKGSDESSVAQVTATKNLAEPTVTIDASGITNTNVYTGTAAGSLAASVTYNDAAIDGAAVTWSGNNDAVATINTTTGAVTLVAAGSVTFTATYAGNGDYSEKTATYEMTVTNEDPSIVTIWSENFVVSGYSSRAETYGYTTTSSSVQTSDNYAGGTAPEMMVGKNGGTFSATIPLLTSSYGYSGDLTLKYKTNAKSLNVKTTTDGLSVEGEESTGTGVTYSTSGEHTITFKGVTTSTVNMTIVFTATSSDNVRLDDIILKGVQEAITKVATPTFSPASGAVASGTEVTIECLTAGATIHYTTDDSTPTSSSTAYNPSSKPTITAATTIKAIAVKDGLTDSDVASASYTIAEPCATPTFSPEAGLIEKGDEVEISCTTVGATIYYTTDGSTPTTSSTVYYSAITVNTGLTIKAIAVKDGHANSAVASATYTVIDYTTLPFDWNGGTSSALTALTGVTANGLGSDYAVANAPYRIKMDGANDYIQIKTDCQPGYVTIDVKMLGGGDTSKIKIQESADGSSFTDVEELTISGSQNDVLNLATTKAFKEATRYVKIIKSFHGSNIGVGPISILKNKPAPSVNGDNEIESDVAIGDGESLIISSLIKIPSGKKITVSSTGVIVNTDASNLVIEDGGQLKINNNATVAATIKKSTAVSSASKTAANNLYAIASPVDGVEISSFAQGYAPLGAHNVYRYDGPTSVWQEYRNDDNKFDDLEIGRGYLYRSSVAGIDLAGEVTGGDASGEVSYSLSYNGSGAEKFRGLNLVGNPFTHNITWNNLTLENVEKGGCYVLNETPGDANQGKWQAVVKGSVDIKPTQAFFVQATDESASITFKNTAGGGKGENYANDNIMFSVKNSKCSDEAYVMFAEGHGLNKIEHRNSEIPMLYIMNNGQNYAIADMSDDTEVINIGFEAKTMGQYTFSIKTEGQYSYMHLVDKLTGEDVDMLVEDSYTFVGAPNDRKDRFVLNLNYNAANINTDSDIFAYQSGSDIIIRGDGELHVFDVMGRLVLTQRVNGVETISVQSQGVYIFKLNGMTQKIVVR